MMIRKHLLLPPELDRRLALEAKVQGKSESQMIREFIDAGLQQRENETSIGEALLGFAALGQRHDLKAKTPPDLSDRLDDYLYGETD